MTSEAKPHSPAHVMLSFFMGIALVTIAILGFFSWYDASGAAPPAIHLAMDR